MRRHVKTEIRTSKDGRYCLDSCAFISVYQNVCGVLCTFYDRLLRETGTDDAPLYVRCSQCRRAEVPTPPAGKGE